MKFNCHLLKKHRNAKYKNAARFAEALSKTGMERKAGSIRKWESGKNPVTIQQLELCADVLGVDLSEFFDFTGREKILGEKEGDNNMNKEIGELREQIGRLKQIIEIYEQAYGPIPFAVGADQEDNGD